MKREKIPFSERVARFMYGRYGMDSLNKFILWVYVALIVLNLIVKNIILNGLALALMVVCLIRFLSKNTWKRQKENQLYLILRDRVTRWVRIQRNKWADRKTKVYRKCPGCKKCFGCPERKAHTAWNAHAVIIGFM